jgi:hypothetical protein
VRPFGVSLDQELIGAPVVVYPIPEKKRTTNPRDLTFDELEHIEILTGTVLEISDVTPSNSHLAHGFVPYDGRVDFGPIRGTMKSRMWLLESGFLETLVGRQVVAVTNLDAARSDGFFEEDMAAVLTVNGAATVEPAKVVENGFKLA